MNLDERITFIVCCPRSGSTWLRFLLNSHPQIACENETFIFTSSAGLGNVFKAYDLELGFKGLRLYVSKPDLIKYTREYLESIFGGYLDRKQKTFLVEKSVDHGYCIPLIKDIFPKSKFIHLIRDGRDVAISLIEASKNWKPEYPNNLNEAFETWSNSNSEIETHLKSVSENEKYFLKYEDLCLNPSLELTRIFEFVGGSKLSDEQINTIVENNGFDKLKSKYKNWGNGGFFRVGKTNQWKSIFSENEKKDAIDKIGKMLQMYHYETVLGI